MRAPVGVPPPGEILVSSWATFPLSCLPIQNGEMESTVQKTYLNTIDILELEEGGRVQELKVDAVRVPAFINDITG